MNTKNQIQTHVFTTSPAPRRFSVFARATAWLTLCAGLLALPAHGAIWSWSGGGGANAYWNNSANWGFAGIPANGDTVIFPASQPNELNTNNIAGLTLNQIRFVGGSGGYDIRGNAFTVTNNIEATNSVGANTIENNITLATMDQSVDVAASLTLSGVLSGSVGLVKNGTGTLLLNGPFSNTYGGTTTVNAGLVQLGKAGFPIAAQAIPGNLVIGNGLVGATVQNIYGLEFSAHANVTVNLGSTWDLNNNSETINTNLTLSGGTVSTGSGTLTLPANAVITLANGYNSSISGNLNIGTGTLSILGSGYLYNYANVTGSANIIQNSVNTIWYGANTYTGNYTANGYGFLDLASSQALGNTNNSLTVNDLSYVLLVNNINLTNQSVTFNSLSGSYTIYSYPSNTNSWHANFTLNTSCLVEVDTAGGLTFNVNNSITGAGGITKLGAGSLTLGGADNVSSYAGDTIVNQGTLNLASANIIRYGTLRIGDGVGGAQADVVRYLTGYCIYGGPGGSSVVITNSGLLDLNGFTDDVGPITMDGATINTGSGKLQLFPPLATIASANGPSTINGNFQLIQNSTLAVSNNLNLNATVSSVGTYNLTKTGQGFLYMNSPNSYTGTNIIQQGWMYINNSTALGSANNSTIVSNGATLAMNGDFAVTNASLTLNGPGEGGWSALDSETGGGTNLWVGPIILNATSTFGNYNGSWLRVNGSISGPGGLEVNAGSVSLEGSTANTFAGVATVDSFTTLLLDKIGVFDGAIPGSLVINGTARWNNLNQVANNSAVTINSGGLLDLNTSLEGLGTITGTGTLALGTQFLDMYGTSTYTFNGTITGSGYFRNQATGTAILNGNNTYTGATIANVGPIVVNGSQPQSPVSVSSGTYLGGSGTVGTIAANGNISPGTGSGPAILSSSNVTFSASGSLTVQLTGPTPGSGYDQLNVTGTNALNGATLNVIPAFTTPVALGQQFIILNNNGGQPITGTFNGLAEGASITAANYKFTISYVGGTGNDVVLTLTSIPGAVTGSTVTSGDGSHGIDPNGCNNLALAITNTSGSAMTGINATLSTTTPGVLITQPYAPYPNIPAGGKGTNLAPFQISTLPSFVCGTPISLQLSVNSGLGSFTMSSTVASGEPATVPNRYDVTGNVGIPDIGAVDSTNAVSGLIGPLQKVVVSLYITHPFDSDLTNISLISPDGTSVLLSSANGGGSANYGSGITPDASRTTFDDAAGTAITAGTAPFVGTFRPQSPLSAFIGNGTPNGNWHLHIADGFGGSVGTLRAWSLFLTGDTCTTGSGSCDYCLTAVTGSIANTDPIMTNRFIRNGIVASCGAPKTFPGTSITGGPTYHYDLYAFTNTSASEACVTVLLTGAGDIQAGVYLNSFDPSNITTNYIADSGGSTLTSNAGSPVGPQSCSVEIAAGAKFFVEVNEVTFGSGSTNYTLQLSGLPCPPPTLSIQPVPATQARLYWPTWAGGYQLESETNLLSNTWAAVTNEPLVSSLKFNVTNFIGSPTNRFYRLHKP